MQRVLVIGSGGAGKSTFAEAMAARTTLPLVHLDACYWRPGWIEPSKAEWAATIETLVAEPSWIMDGNYGGSLDRRLNACDTVIFLDLPWWICIRRVILRWIRYRGRTRPDMTQGCTERLSAPFLWWILSYPLLRRPQILRCLAELPREKTFVRLRRPGAVDRYLSALAARPAS